LRHRAIPFIGGTAKCDLPHIRARAAELDLSPVTGTGDKTMPHHQEKFDQEVLAARQRLIEQLNALSKAFQR
jgi:hypothetical protein